MPEPQSYADAIEQGRALVAQARLADPGEHFPYKRDVVTALLADNPPMGPGMPGRVDGAADRTREAADYMSEGIAAASDVYIAAQAAYLADPCDDNKAAYDTARDRLQAARLDHRASRGEGFVVGGAARRAG
jgi:hypothetical protein